MKSSQQSKIEQQIHEIAHQVVEAGFTLPQAKKMFVRSFLLEMLTKHKSQNRVSAIIGIHRNTMRYHLGWYKRQESVSVFRSVGKDAVKS